MSTPHRPLTEGEISFRIKKMTVLHHIRPKESSTFFKLFYITSTVIVFSYIFFEVLDVDGSNFPLRQYPGKSSVVVADALKDIERSYLSGLVELGKDSVPPSLGVQTDSVLLHRAGEPGPSVRDLSRHHGYRVALPRSSTSDPSHSA